MGNQNQNNQLRDKIHRFIEMDIEGLERNMLENLTSYLSGSLVGSPDAQLASIATLLSSWLGGAHASMTQVRITTALLLMDQWGIDIPRIRAQLDINEDHMMLMIMRLQKYGMIRNNELCHDWYDRSGASLKNQILISTSIMMDRMIHTTGR